MEEETKPQDQQSTAESWQEVGRQFEALGKSLAAAFRTAWQSNESRQNLEKMKSGMEQMARDVNDAVKASADTPEAKQAREHMKQAAAAARDASKQALADVRPQLLEGLKRANAELEKAITRWEAETKSEQATEPGLVPSSMPPSEDGEPGD